MTYFTAEEAARIIRNSPSQPVSRGGPNREAISAALDEAGAWGNGAAVRGVAYGFLIGRATGIREERARRRKAAGNAYAAASHRALSLANAREWEPICAFAKGLVGPAEERGET